MGKAGSGVTGHMASGTQGGVTYHRPMASESVDPEVSAADFQAVDREAWMALAEVGLRGRTVDSLATTTADGIRIPVVYGSDQSSTAGDPAGLPGAGTFTRGRRSSGQVVDGWDVRALVVEDGIGASNAVVLDELLRGSTSVLLDPMAVGIESLRDLDGVLDGVHLEMTTVALVPGPRSVEVAGWMLDLWEERSVPEGDRCGDLGLDPMGVHARHGGPDVPGVACLDAGSLAVVDRARGLPGVRPVTVDTTPYADAGTSDARELAAGLATGVAYLRALTDHGLSLSEALRSLTFTLTADADQFLTLARFRAARRLWARVAEASGADMGDRAPQQHAITSAVMLTRWDPWVNMLRSTVAAFAAGTGGADSVTVRPFDSALGRPDEFGRRTARNLQLVLLEESGLARVIDPAGGSWYVEDLTARLAMEAWERFREIEADGGMAAALASGRLAAEAEACWRERAGRLADLSESVTGVSEFPNVEEVLLERQPLPAPPTGPLPLRRRSEPFEVLRDAVVASDPVPTVLLVTLGPAAEHMARSTFARNLFGVAGIRAVEPGDPAGATRAPGPDGSGGAGSDAGGALIAVLCGSDERYRDEAAAVVGGLKAAGVQRVYLAGRAGDDEADLRASGVDEFIHAGVDVVDLLSRTLDDLGVVR